MTELKAIEIWESYVGKDAPSNAAGERRGYGRTPDEATFHAVHWSKSGPVGARAKGHGLRPREAREPHLQGRGSRVGDRRSRERIPPLDSGPRRDLQAEFHAGKYASAILAYYEAIQRGEPMVRLDEGRTG